MISDSYSKRFAHLTVISSLNKYLYAENHVTNSLIHTLFTFLIILTYYSFKIRLIFHLYLLFFISRFTAQIYYFYSQCDISEDL